jgi:hypothetical protein
MYTGIGSNSSYINDQKAKQLNLIKKVCSRYNVERIESNMQPYPKQWLAEKFLLGAAILRNEVIDDILCDIMIYNRAVYIMPIEEQEE